MSRAPHEISESFLPAPRRHKSAVTPPLPVSQSGVNYARSDRPSTALYGPTAEGNQSGERIVGDVELKYADYVERAVNQHDELVAALKALADAVASTEIAATVAGWDGPADDPNPRHDPRLGARIDTNCGQMYDMRDALVAAQALIAKAEA